jgi:protein-L-isoaspartate(D-aspartate) O-methyltransferase
MVDVVRRRDLYSGRESDGGIEPRILEALAKVPRHEFVSANLRNRAYDDSPLPIGRGQTVSQPYIVALMTHLIHPQPDHRVLEVGTGSGYQAAVLSRLVDHVFSIEVVPELAKQAEQRLRRLGYDNVSTRLADGWSGWPEESPFDAILVTAAPEMVPPPLLEQLKVGGRLVAPVGSRWERQDLLVVERRPDGETSTQRVIPVAFVPLVRWAEEGD